MTRLVVAVDSSRAEVKLGRVKSGVYANVLRAVTRLSINLQAYVKENKLTGQVLHTRTGTLRRSINREVTSTPSAIRAVVGTNVEYAAGHEYGFNGDVNVKAHLRQITQAWGRPISPRSVQVQAHTKHVVLPERSFLRSALKDFEDRIVQDIRGAAKEGAK